MSFSFGASPTPTTQGFTSPPVQTPPPVTPQYTPVSPQKPKKTGGRSVILLMRAIVLGTVLTLAGLGVYHAAFPPSQLSEKDVAKMVNSTFGYTTFPVSRAESIVLSFTRAYLDTSYEGRDAILKAYSADASDSLSVPSGKSPISGVSSDVLVGDVYIAGIKYNSGTDATFTVYGVTRVLGEVALSIPVAYDKASDSFAISSAPSLVPLPARAGGLDHKEESRVIGTESSIKPAELQPLISSFFTAWGKTDIDTLTSITVPGQTTPKSYVGLRGMWENKKVTILQVTDSPDGSVMVRVNVQWQRQASIISRGEDNEDDEEAQPITMECIYLVKLVNSNGQYKVVDVGGNSFYATKFNESATTDKVGETKTDTVDVPTNEDKESK